MGINENIKNGRISEFHNTVRISKSRNKNVFNTMTKGILQKDDLFLNNIEHDLLRKSYQINEVTQPKVKSIDFGKNFKMINPKQQIKFNSNSKSKYPHLAKPLRIVNVNSGTNTDSVTRTNLQSSGSGLNQDLEVVD